MAFFRVKTGWKRPRKREYKNYRSVSFQPDAKKFKKLKYTIMASFQAKIGWKMPRKRKNKNYRSGPFRSYPTRN